MGEIIRIGMAELNITQSPNVLTTLGLGSCVGIVLYDPVIKVAGMIHAMLPCAEEMKDHTNIAKFADTGTLDAYEKLKKIGASSQRIVAKIAGGAQMFAFNQMNDSLKVGARNIAAAKQILNSLRIPIIAEDTGGNFGRTIEFYTETGILLIKTVGQGSKEI